MSIHKQTVLTLNSPTVNNRIYTLDSFVDKTFSKVKYVSTDTKIPTDLEKCVGIVTDIEIIGNEVIASMKLFPWIEEIKDQIEFVAAGIGCITVEDRIVHDYDMHYILASPIESERMGEEG